MGAMSGAIPHMLKLLHKLRLRGQVYVTMLMKLTALLYVLGGPLDPSSLHVGQSFANAVQHGLQHPPH